jgi:RNA 3'-terminal phosphate cyclase (ATP)
LLLPMALWGGGSFTTFPLSLHSTTNIEVIRIFLDVAIDVRQMDDARWQVGIVARHV